MIKRLFKLSINIIPLILSLCIIFGFADVFFRFYDKPDLMPFEFEAKAKVCDGIIHPTLKMVKDPIQLYELKANQHICIENRCETINKYGFRGANNDLDRYNDENSIRIAMLGDSFTYGYGVGDTETLPMHLEGFLNFASNKHILVLNFGISGYNSAQIARLLQNKVMSFRPHIVIYNYFPNDPEFWEQENPSYYMCASMFSWKQPILKILVGSRLVEFIWRRIGMKYFADHGQDNGYWILIHHALCPGWWITKQSIKEMKKITQEAGIFFCVSLLAYDDTPFNEKSETLGKVDALCKSLNIPVINNSNCFVGNNKSYEKLWTTIGPPHYSNLGNRLIAEHISQQLVEFFSLNIL